MRETINLKFATNDEITEIMRPAKVGADPMRVTSQQLIECVTTCLSNTLFSE